MNNDAQVEFPPDEQFREHLEAVLNPNDVLPIEVNDYQSDVHIPVLDEPIGPNE